MIVFILIVFYHFTQYFACFIRTVMEKRNYIIYVSDFIKVPTSVFSLQLVLEKKISLVTSEFTFQHLLID